jgi:peptide/nickel transport system ATP-binding protein
MRLIPNPPGKIESGEILFKGKNLLAISNDEMRLIRGSQIGMIFQEPMTSLNPVFTVGNQIAESIHIHNKDLSRKELHEKTLQMLKLVGIPSPETRINDYPHQLSGGMRQRIMIAMALSCNPKLLIADEPTTALDVTIQAQILDLIKKLQKEFHTALILITHDLGVVAETCDNVAVMYAGRIIEEGSSEDIFNHPKHPYTKGLLNSVPHFETIGSAQTNGRRKRLETIPGIVPSLADLPQGCRFQARCSYVSEECRKVDPPLTTIEKDHKSACYHPVPG